MGFLMQDITLGDQVQLPILSLIGAIFEEEPVFSDTWAKYRRSLLIDGSCWYETPIIYGLQPAGAVSTENALFCRVNLPFYQSFAAMLTGAGLLLTFLAFFIGLSKIQILGGAISGLPGLINGLSGKFVTSIVGLACASVFVIFEKGLFHRLLMTYQALIDRVDQVFPYRGSSE